MAEEKHFQHVHVISHSNNMLDVGYKETGPNLFRNLWGLS